MEIFGLPEEAGCFLEAECEQGQMSVLRLFRWRDLGGHNFKCFSACNCLSQLGSVG